MNSHYPTRLSRPVSLQPDIAMTANGAWLSAQEIMRAVTAGRMSALSVTEAALALPVEDAWKPAVRTNLEVSLKLARLVDEFALPDEAEPASVFAA